MQIGPLLGNSRRAVIRSFRRPNKKAALFARLLRAWCLPYFSEATGPLEFAAGSGSKPNTPTRYL